MNSYGFQRSIAFYLWIVACCGWPLESGSKADELLGRQQTQAAAAHLREQTEEPPDHSGTAQALVAVHRKRYAAMSEAELTRHQRDLEARCMQLQREGDPVENEYRRQLAMLRASGQFSATAFGAIAENRQALLQKWIQAVAEVAALPRFENDPLVQAVLDAYLQEVSANSRLARDLAVLVVDDRLPDGNAMGKAQELLRALERERDPPVDTTPDTEKPGHIETPRGEPSVCRGPKEKVVPGPACSAWQRSTVHCKWRPRGGCGAGLNR